MIFQKEEGPSRGLLRALKLRESPLTALSLRVGVRAGAQLELLTGATPLLLLLSPPR